MPVQLDLWQQQVLDTPGNIVLRSGRQVGKSFVIGLKAALYALDNSKKVIIVISKTERQAELLFTKILQNIVNLDKSQILKGKDRPTKSKIRLKNGSIIYCLPAGDTGYGLMGFTIDLLIADEAAFIPEEVWNSLIPALAITRGAIWLLSTPFVKEGFYYQCFSDPTFTSFHTTSEECPRRDEVFLAHKKATLTKAQYSQMYLGEFQDEFRQFFSDEQIKEVCVLKRRANKLPDRQYFLGVDVARMGEDLSTFEVIDGTDNIYEQVENLTTSQTLTTDTINTILMLERIYYFNIIGVDDAGVGAGVFDQLKIESLTRHKTIGINNARKSIDENTNQKRRILKEDLYNETKRLIEFHKLKLLEDDEIKASMKSIQYEYVNGQMKIGSDEAHIVEGIIRALWCIRGKHLKLWVR